MKITSRSAKPSNPVTDESIEELEAKIEEGMRQRQILLDELEALKREASPEAQSLLAEMQHATRVLNDYAEASPDERQREQQMMESVGAPPHVVMRHMQNYDIAKASQSRPDVLERHLIEATSKLCDATARGDADDEGKWYGIVQALKEEHQALRAAWEPPKAEPLTAKEFEHQVLNVAHQMFGDPLPVDVQERVDAMIAYSNEHVAQRSDPVTVDHSADKMGYAMHQGKRDQSVTAKPYKHNPPLWKLQGWSSEEEAEREYEAEKVRRAQLALALAEGKLSPDALLPSELASLQKALDDARLP